jgi:general secretion pathway protein D
MININKILIIFLILLTVLSASALAGPEAKIENMSFKNADIVDVLRTVAEVAEVNLITDSEITGNITVQLKDINFKKALDLITQTRSLDYRWDNNTVVVAAPERLDKMYADIVTEYIKVESNDFDNIAVIVKEIFPETQISLDAPRKQFIVKGEEKVVAEIKEMINRLDAAKKAEDLEMEKQEQNFAEQNIEFYSESYQVMNADLEDLKNKLQAVNSQISVKTNSLTNIMTVRGEKANVNESLAMAKTYDQSLEPETRNVRVDYVDTEQITEIVGKFYPDINLHVNKKRKEIIINGAKNKLDNVVDLIKEINRPQYQVVIETRVEEVSSDFNREIGMDYESNTLGGIGNIIIERNDDNDKINKLNYKWPEIFKLLDTSTDSKTIASPSLMTLNGEEAKLSIKEEEPYAVIEEDDDGTKTTSWEFTEAGVDLTFTPWITENNEIELKIAPEVSSFYEINPDRYTGANTTPPPATKTRSVETTLRLKDNETFAIGGLIQTDGEGKITKIPLLGDLPIFGELFKSRSKSDSTNELIIFVTPHIIKYGDEVNNKNIINPKNDKINKNKEEIKLENKENAENTPKENNLKEPEQSKEEIINEFLAERRKEREEILKNIKEDNDKDKEYQELTPEELEAILEN